MEYPCVRKITFMVKNTEPTSTGLTKQTIQMITDLLKTKTVKLYQPFGLNLGKKPKINLKINSVPIKRTNG